MAFYIKVDSNKITSKIYGCCSDCAKKAAKLPENRHKTKFVISTWHNGECDVCHMIKPVTQVRDFGFPVFKIKAHTAEEILQELAH